MIIKIFDIVAWVLFAAIIASFLYQIVFFVIRHKKAAQREEEERKLREQYAEEIKSKAAATREKCELNEANAKHVMSTPPSYGSVSRQEELLNVLYDISVSVQKLEDTVEKISTV